MLETIGEIIISLESQSRGTTFADIYSLSPYTRKETKQALNQLLVEGSIEITDDGHYYIPEF
jgi:hypothetical protein